MMLLLVDESDTLSCHDCDDSPSHKVYLCPVRVYVITKSTFGNIVVGTACEKTVASMSRITDLVMALGSVLPELIVAYGAPKLGYFKFGAGARQFSHTRFRIMEGIAQLAVLDLRMSSLTWVLPR